MGFFWRNNDLVYSEIRGQTYKSTMSNFVEGRGEIHTKEPLVNLLGRRGRRGGVGGSSIQCAFLETLVVIEI